MGAIYRREVKAYFTSPIAYVFMAILYFFAGLPFVRYNINYGVSDVTIVFSETFFILMFIIPLLTMRLFTEERRTKTDQCLLTAPVNLFSIVAAKFLAACTIFLSGMAIFLLFALILRGLAGDLDWAIFIGNFAGYFLLGAAFIAIGVFISAMTENQVVAAILAFIVNFLLYQVDTFATGVTNKIVAQIMVSIGFYSKYNEFISGILDLTIVLFFISVIFIFNFLTVRVLERRRWN
jgi:ABC-2 type transport system permease protein